MIDTNSTTVEAPMRETCAHPGCKNTKILARVEGKPYCSSHYKNIRDKLKSELTIDLLRQLDKVFESNPGLEKSLKGLPRLKSFFSVFKPKAQSDAARRIAELEAQIQRLQAPAPVRDYESDFNALKAEFDKIVKQIKKS